MYLIIYSGIQYEETVGVMTKTITNKKSNGLKITYVFVYSVTIVCTIFPHLITNKLVYFPSVMITLFIYKIIKLITSTKTGNNHYQPGEFFVDLNPPLVW